MKPFETNWWWRGGNAPMLDRREIIGITPIEGALNGDESCVVHLRGGNTFGMSGTTEYVQAQIYGRWPPDAPEEVDPVPSGTKQPLETMNVSGAVLAADIQAAWREASSEVQHLPPDVDRAVYDGAIQTMVDLLCARLGILVAMPRSTRTGDAGVKKG